MPTVNNDTLMWNTGNIGDRRPQVRLGWKEKAGHGAFSVEAAAGLTGAVDSQDLDNNGVRDGEASGAPNVQISVNYAGPRAGDRWAIGIAGLYGWQQTATLVGNRDRFNPRALALSARFPLRKGLTLQGEAWSGRNLADFRGGIAQSVNSDKSSPGYGREVRSRGG